jgi:hypothetical protein
MTLVSRKVLGLLMKMRNLSTMFKNMVIVAGEPFPNSLVLTGVGRVAG